MHTSKQSKPTINGVEVSCLPVSNTFFLSPFQGITAILNLMCIFLFPKEQSWQPEVNKIHNEGTLKKYLIFKVPQCRGSSQMAPKEQDSSQATPVPTEDKGSLQTIEQLPK